MKVALREIDDSNRALCIALKTASEQEAYIAANEVSLQEAQREEYADIARPFAIYADESVVGFVMFAFDEKNEDPADK